MKKLLFVLCASLLSFGLSAQCPDLSKAQKPMASSFHSSLMITYDSVVRYWGDNANPDTSGIDILSPRTLASSRYTGYPISVAAGSVGSSTHQLFLHTSGGLYGWGVSAGTIDAATTGVNTAAWVSFRSIPLPAGLAIANVAYIEAAGGGLAIVTKNGAVWIKSGYSSGTGLLYGDGTATGTINTNWHKVKTSSAASDTLTGVVRLSMSSRACMALTASGSVYVWGENVFTGSGGATDLSYATLVTKPSGVTPSDVLVNSMWTYDANTANATEYILGTDGLLYAIGENFHGNLGQSNTTDATSWVTVKGPGGVGNLSNIVLIGSNNPYPLTSASYSMGALTSNGKLYLWGDNNSDMLGNDTLFAADSTFYTIPRIPPNFSLNNAQIGFFEMGGHTTAAFLAGSSKFCYVGHKIRGSMGDNDGTTGTRKSFDCINTPSEYVCPPSPPIGCPLPSAKDIVASSMHATLAINGQPTAAFWGQSSSSAEPGIDVPAPKTLYEYNGDPVAVAASGTSETVAGQATQMWVQTAQGIWGWGYSGNTINASRPGVLPITQLTLPSGVAGSDVNFIRSSRGGIAIVTNAGTVYVRAGAGSACSGRAYGDGSSALDAAGSTVWHQVKTAAATNLSGVIELSFSGTSVLAITNTGAAYVWGDNVMLGDASAAANRTYATQMTLHSDFSASMVPRSSEIITTPGVEAAILMVGSNNKLYTLGRNLNGALGTGSSTFTTVATSWNALAAPIGVKRLSSNNAYANGFYAFGAITLTGNVYLWGANNNGMLGFGATANITSPTVASTVPANDATAFEIGGNQTIIFSKASSPRFYFAGHVQGGSMGDGTADGTVTSFTLAGSVPNCANITFDISGNVYNDVNGLTDSVVNGTAISSIRGTALYANLLDESGYVVSSTTISGGAYSFTGFPFANYYVQISPTAGTIFALAPTTALPDNWVNVGEQIGTTAGSGIDTGAPDGRILVQLASTRSNVNFGVEQKPSATTQTLSSRVNPGGTATANIAAGFTGVDTGGTVAKIHITSFPTNATSITIGASTYTSATWPPAGVTYTVSGTNVGLDPIDGAVTSVMNFKVLDNAGVESPAAATLSIPFILIPPVAINVTTQAINSQSAETAIPQLMASGAANTAISSYTLSSVPAAAQGVLYYCGTYPPTCTSGTYTAVTAGTTLTPTQAATLFFDPAQTFTGNVNFNYYATDVNALQSNVATYTIPVFNEKPVTQPIRTTQIVDTMHAAPLPGLRGADPDGTVVSYTLNSIPAATQGVLSYCSTADEPCTGVVTTINSGTTVTPAQMQTLKFDPTAGFTGDYTFQYVATDNNGNVSAPSTFAIPVVSLGTISGNQPPVAENITAQVLNSSRGRTSIPNLLGTDPDGSVTTYTIGASVPNPATEGTLYYCMSAPCTLASLTALTAGTDLTPTQAASLHFDPVQGFIGTASFTYTVKDNGAPALTSNTATYSIPVFNNPPIANPTITSPINNAKLSPTLLPALSGSDQDGTVVSYNINSVPAATDGILKYCLGPAACTPATLTTISGPVSGLTPAQAATLNFIPSSSFTGNYVFSFSTVDNNGLVSQPATVTIPVVAASVGVGEPPVAYSFNAPSINSSSTATLDTALRGTDPDGTIAFYTIGSIPVSTSGSLSYCATPPSTGCGTAVLPGTVLTAAQAATLLFTPNATFKGIASFTYTNTDNDGNLSNTATVTVPVNNAPPKSLNISNTALNRTAGPATLSPLSSSDVDGTVVSYTIQSIPSADQGVLSLCTTPPSTGCTPVTAGQTITPAQITNLSFNPDTLAYVPVISFMYSTLDNSGNVSNLATVDIPIVNALELPVTLISFNAVKQGDRNALISWLTGVEQAGVQYQLMHGTNGKDWSLLDVQQAQLANGNQYSYLHRNVTNGTHYYRLRIVDAEKAESFSPTRSLSFSNGQTISVLCQPNPVSEKLYFSTNDGSALSLIEVFSNEGRIVKSAENIASGAALDMSDCASGIYLIRVTDASGQVQVLKVSKR